MSSLSSMSSVLPSDPPSSSSTTWQSIVQVPVEFTTTLFEPFIDERAQDFYRKQISKVQQQGVTGYAWEGVQRIWSAVKKHPLDTLTLSTGVFLNFVDVKNLSLLLVVPAKTATTIPSAKFLKQLGDSVDSRDCVGIALKVSFYAAVIYCISSVPVGHALEWNSVADAKAHYSGGSCPTYPWKELMHPARDCLEGGQSLQECHALATGKTINDFYVFARHASSDPELDPVSITRLDEGKVCFLTQLTKTSGVTKTCFVNLSDPSTRTVERMDELALMKAHEGLAPGNSIQHIGMMEVKDPYQFTHRAGACGYFHDVSNDHRLGEKPICLLTSLEPGGDVSQTCFNPVRPESLTLKKITGIALNYPDDGKPVSIVIEDPKAIGIDVSPESPGSGPDTCPPPSQGVRFWDALSWWWNQKTPCEDSIEEV